MIEQLLAKKISEEKFIDQWVVPIPQQGDTILDKITDIEMVYISGWIYHDGFSDA
ncbi:MAG: hypothetical protein ACTFAK_11590 [Candidatus Electronema sp. VV]